MTEIIPEISVSFTITGIDSRIGARVKLDALAEYGHDARMFVMPRCTSEDSTMRISSS